MKFAIPFVFLLAAVLPRLSWQQKHPLPKGVGGGVAGLLGGNLVYAGGASWANGVKQFLRDVSVYHIATDRWSSGPALPVPLAYGPAIHTGDVMEIFGGTDGKQVYRESWRLESGKSAWTSTGKAPADTLLGRAEQVGGQVFLFGGCSDVGDLTRCSDAVQMRPPGGGWSRVSAMPQGPISMPASAVVRGRVYLFGGCWMPKPNRLINRADAYVFDPASKKWQQLAPLPHANRGLSAAVLDDRYVLLCGGFTASEEEAAGKAADFGFSSEVLAYDVEKGTYTKLAPLPLAAADIEVVIHDGVLYGLGGEHRMRDRTPQLVAAKLR